MTAAEQAREFAELAEQVKQTKRTVKGLMGQLRVTTQFLAALADRLDEARGRLEPTAQEAEHDREPEPVAV